MSKAGTTDSTSNDPVAIQVTKTQASAAAKRLRQILSEELHWSGSHQQALVLTAKFLGYRNQEHLAASYPDNVNPAPVSSKDKTNTLRDNKAGLNAVGSPRHSISQEEVIRLLKKTAAKTLVFNAKSNAMQSTTYESAVNRADKLGRTPTFFAINLICAEFSARPHLFSAVLAWAARVGKSSGPASEITKEMAASFIVGEAHAFAIMLWDNHGYALSSGKSAGAPPMSDDELETGLQTGSLKTENDNDLCHGCRHLVKGATRLRGCAIQFETGCLWPGEEDPEGNIWRCPYFAEKQASPAPRSNRVSQIRSMLEHYAEISAEADAHIGSSHNDLALKGSELVGLIETIAAEKRDEVTSLLDDLVQDCADEGRNSDEAATINNDGFIGQVSYLIAFNGANVIDLIRKELTELNNQQ